MGGEAHVGVGLQGGKGLGVADIIALKQAAPFAAAFQGIDVKKINLIDVVHGAGERWEEAGAICVELFF